MISHYPDLTDLENDLRSVENEVTDIYIALQIPDANRQYKTFDLNGHSSFLIHYNSFIGG
jgi:hypothetical protein